MEILLATVKDNNDFTHMGKVKASIGTTGERTLIEVYYSSPYGGESTHGFFAIPPVGTDILIVKPANYDQWFYMTSVFWNKPSMASEDNLPVKDNSITEDPYNPFGPGDVLPSRLIYNPDDIPATVGIKTPLGNQLLLSDDRNKEYDDVRAEMRSSVGKRLVLHDGPGIDSVLLRNEHGDGIQISSRAIPGMGQASRMVEVQANGPVRVISSEGCIDIRLEDGLNIDITNNSTGSKRSPNSPNNFGNININSRYGDVNLRVKSDNSNIRLVTEGSNSNIHLSSQNRVTIECAKNLDLASGQNINISAANAVNIEGAVIHLNK